MSGGGMTNQISNWAGGGATTTLGAVQLAYGMYKQKHNKRPTYEIPPEIAQNLSQAQHDALQGMPEEQKQQYLSNLQRSNAYALSQSNSRKGGLAGISSLNESNNGALGNLASMDAGARMQNQDKLYGARQTMADYRDQAFQINKSNPYYEQTAQNSAMIGAGMQNMSQGFQQGNTGGGGDYGKSMEGNTPDYKRPNYYATDYKNPTTPTPSTSVPSTNFGGGSGYGQSWVSGNQ
jgi:hypothetical protein